MNMSLEDHAMMASNSEGMAKTGWNCLKRDDHARAIKKKDWHATSKAACQG